MTSRRDGLALWGAALALLLLSCPKPEDPPGSPSPRLTALQEQRFGMAQVRAALFSVAYHSQRPPPDLPWQLSPMSLYEAARILRDGAGDKFGESRRRRSAIDLAIGGLERPGGVWQVRQINDSAIGILLGGFKPKFDVALNQILLGLPPFPRPPAPPDPEAWKLPPKFVRELRLRLWQFIDHEHEVSVSICRVTVPPTTTDSTDPNTGVVEVKTTLAVSGQIDSISKALDPQNWDAINFATGKPCSPYFEVANEYEKDPNGLWVPDTCPQAPGSQWDGYLFEFFDADFGFISQANFSTILAIKRPSGIAPTWGFDYELETFYSAKVVVDPFARHPLILYGGIDTDEGDLDAVKNASEVQLHAVKRIHFVGWKDEWGNSWDDAMNASAVLTLRAMGGALAEAACCHALDPLPCEITGGTP